MLPAASPLDAPLSDVSLPSDAPPPHSYRAFGLAVVSDLALPGFIETEETEAPDVRIRRGPVASPQESDGEGVIRTYPEGVFRASIENGHQITVDPDPEADPDFVSTVISGELFAAVLRQRGLLVLHGSAVARGDRAVGFIGHSGWGKSTLAATLVRRGWQLLTDDLLVVSGLADGRSAAPENERAPTVVAGHPSMRLAHEAADRVADADHARHRAHGRTTKIRMDWEEAFLDAPVPLHAVFVLDPQSYEAPGIAPIPRHIAALELAHHTRVQQLLSTPPERAAHLAQCADLTRRVPVSYLHRQFGLDHVPALCDLVEEAVAE